MENNATNGQGIGFNWQDALAQGQAVQQSGAGSQFQQTPAPQVPGNTGGMSVYNPTHVKILSSINQAYTMGATPQDIVNEIAKQNPHKQQVFQQATSMGATPQDIVQEIIKQNTPGYQRPQQGGGFLSTAGNVASSVGNFLTSNEQAAGQDIAAAIGGQSYIQNQSNINQGISDSLLQYIKALEAGRENSVKNGLDTSHYDVALAKVAQQIGQKTGIPAEQVFPALAKTNSQVFGDIASVGLDLTLAGKLSSEAKTGKLLTTAKSAAGPTFDAAVIKNIEGNAPTTANKLGAVAKNWVKNSAIYGGYGYAYDVAGNLQQGKTGAQAATPGLGTAIGLAIPFAGALAKTGKIAAKASAPRIINSLVKPLLKDFAYGKNPGAEIANQGIKANSLEDLAQKVGDRRSQIGQEIGSISQKLDARLSTGATGAVSPGRGLKLEDSLRPIDEAMQQAALGNNQTLLNRLQNVKTALTHDLNLGFDEAGAPKILQGTQRDLSNGTFKQAFEMKKTVGDMTQWTGNPSDDKAVNLALKKVYGKIKEQIDSKASNLDPKLSEQLKKANESYGNLTTAEIATKYRDKIEQRQNIISAPVKAGTIAGLLAAPFTGGLSLPTVLVGLTAAGLDKALGSTAVKTRVAAWLASESPSRLQAFVNKYPKVAQKIDKALGEDILKGVKQQIAETPNKQGGFIKIPGVADSIQKSVHPEDIKIMQKFIDYARTNAPLSNAEFSQAEKIAQKFGINLDRGLANTAKSFENVLTGGKKVIGTAVPGSIPKSSELASQTANLAKEAQKYSSAEEFVKAQGEPLYHGGANDISAFTDQGRGGVFLTPDKTMAQTHADFAANYGKDAGSTPKITEAYATPKKIYQIPKMEDETAQELKDNLIEQPEYHATEIKNLKAKGYDAIKSSDGRQLYVLDPKQVMTKSQLTDFYNKVRGQQATVPTPPDLAPLAKEAQKYSSAEEFVKAQQKDIMYHGSPIPLKQFHNKSGAFFTNSMEDASGFAGTPDNVYEGYLNFKKPLVIDAKGAKWDELNTKYGKSTQEVVSNAQKAGFDGVTFKNIVDNIGDTADVGGESTISYAFKPKDAFLNESQLTDIWNKAHKK